MVSNHENLRPMAEAAGLPFVHVPVAPGTKREAEARLLELVDEHRADRRPHPALPGSTPRTATRQAGGRPGRVVGPNRILT